MLRRKAIIRWSDLYAELSNVLNKLSEGESANLNLLRRSIVMWKRSQGDQHIAAPGSDFVTFSRIQLDELEGALCSAHAAILQLSPRSFKDAAGLIQSARKIVNNAYLSSRSDQQILAMSITDAPSEDLNAELERRHLTRPPTSRSPKTRR